VVRFAELTPTPARRLVTAADAVAVGEALRLADPELGARLVRVRTKRFRLGEGGRCGGTYVLTVRGDDGDAEVTVEATVHEPDRLPAPPPAGSPFGQPGWAVRLDGLGVDVAATRAETVLAAYDELLDPQRAPALLTEVLRTGTRAGEGIVVRRAEAEVLRYKPGSRCTFRMHVETDPDSGPAFPATLIAKTHAGGKGLVADRSMRALWFSPFRDGPIAIAEPLGFDPDRRILLQGPIPEACTLRDVLIGWFAGDRSVPWDRLVDLVTRVGAGLGRLHGSGVTVGEAVGVDAELDEIHRRAARLTAAFPDHGPVLASITTVLDELTGATPPGPALPAHRSFRPAQVLLDGDRMGFIDFDGFCQAEPAMDVAMFCTMVRSIGLNKGVEDKAELLDMAADERDARLADADRLCTAFLTAYRSEGEVDPQRLAAWETVHVAGMVVASWTKLKLARLPNALFLLDEQLDRTGVRRPG
jgi:hypothetical protein